MITQIPKDILEIYKKIQGASFEIYLVGGCVRDILMKRKVKDWDLTTNAPPEEILKIFPDGFYDNKFGTVGVPIKESSIEHLGIVEITTFRTEKGYLDRRHPETVEWGKSIEEDLSRRDFTINALALKIADGLQTTRFDARRADYRLIDPFSGQKDIEQKSIRAVGDPKKRFKEDALRLLRAIRIATELSFIIEENTWKEIAADSSLINEISSERIKGELLRILGSDYPYEGVMLLRNSGLLEQIIPEILEGIDVSQARPGRHHKTDVFTHNLMSLKLTPSKDPIVRFAALIHDIGKPKSLKLDEEGLVTFHNHEVISSRIANQICERLKFSRKEKEKVFTLIRWHMFLVDEKMTDAAIRRFIRRVGVDNIRDMIDLRIGDRLGGGTQTAESWRLKLFKKRVEEQLKPKPFSIEDMAVDGHDVMRKLNIKPGPKVGEILQKLFEEVDENLSKNNKEYLIKRINEINN